VVGELADHAVAFSRGALPGAVTVVPRLPAAGEGGWRGTAAALPAGSWRNLLDGGEHQGGTVAVEDLLGGFPVALLERMDA